MLKLKKLGKSEASGDFNVWWDLPEGPAVSCPKCGFMTRAMNPSYTEWATLKGGKFTCPDCRKSTEIELGD